MRFTIQREVFLKPLRAVAGVVERKLPTSPILSNVLIKVWNKSQFSLTTTDQEVELVAKGIIQNRDEDISGGTDAIEDGAITVPARKLMDVCRALPEGATLSIIEEQDRIILRSGRSRFTLSILPAEEFPSLEETVTGVSFSVSKRALLTLIEQIGFAMAEQDVRYYLNGMLLEIKAGQILGVAADGHRLAFGKMDFNNVDNISHNIGSKETTSSKENSSPKDITSHKESSSSKEITNPKETTRVIIPRKGVLELQRILEDSDEMIEIILSHNHIRVVTSDVQLTSKLLEGRFPDYERLISVSGDKTIVGDREVFKESFQRAAALFSDRFRGVRLRLAGNCLKILANNSEQDEVEEDIEVDYKDVELEIGFNIKYLIDFLTVIQTQFVKFTFSDSNSSARVEGVEGESGIYIIMPMRI